MKYPALKQQGGFTLIELAVVIMLLTILVLTGKYTSTLSDDTFTAKALLYKSRLFADAVLRYKADTGATPMHLKSLFLKKANSAADTTESIDVTQKWRGPYVDGFKFEQDVNGNIEEDSWLPPRSIITLGWVGAANLPRGMSKGLQLNFSNLRNRVVKIMVADCNNNTGFVETLPTTFTAGNKCIGKLETAGAAGSVSYLFYMAP